MSIHGLKMEYSELTQLSSVIQYNDLHPLWMGEMLDALLAHPCRCSGSRENGALHMEVRIAKAFISLCKRHR